MLRKILRRGIRHGRLLGLEDPFLYQMTGYVAELMKGPYPELLTTREYVAKVVKNEEQRFSSTIRIAIDQLSEAFAKIRKTPGPEHVLPGDVMFKFYDTFGLPLDLMQELADETGVKLDEAAFNAKLEAQRERGKASWKDVAASSGPTVVAPSSEKTQFVGYTDLEVADARIVAIHSDRKPVLEVACWRNRRSLSGQDAILRRNRWSGWRHGDARRRQLRSARPQHLSFGSGPLGP